jgi:AcrR family transcriptional regulator
VHAALEAFAERGFHATSTRDIAARAGLSPAGLYVHFTSKEAVLHRISISTLQITRRIADAAAATPGTPADRLAATVRDLAAWHARHGDTARIVLHHLIDLTPLHRDEAVGLQRANYQVIRKLVTEGLAHGGFVLEDPGAGARALLSLCVDAARWYRPDHPRTPEQIGEAYAVLALRMVGVPVG